MRRMLGTAKDALVAVSIALCALFAANCGPTYRPPALPANQLALVSLDSSASVLGGLLPGAPPYSEALSQAGARLAGHASATSRSAMPRAVASPRG